MIQYLVRHGRSVSNQEGRVQGRADVPLSPLGQRQAEIMAGWALSLPHVDEVWSSPLVRARDTAAPIAAALGLEVRVAADLAELDAGIFQGHLWSDLEARFPEAVARWRSGDADFAIPGGESRSQLAARGRAALETLTARAAPAIVVVAHGGILTAALGSLLGRTHPLLAAAAERPFTRLPALENCSVSTLRWPGPELVAFNDTGHLGGMTDDMSPASPADNGPARDAE
ncbi:MAG: histidine phosphatase family protein [Planctomycetia bacterium]